MQELTLSRDTKTNANMGKVKKSKSVLQLLHWAFGAECAQLDLAEFKFSQRAGMASQLRVLQQGCRVDGGGRSLPHHDAELVAGAVASLVRTRYPVGERLAIDVADLARLGKAPDAMVGVGPHCAPVGYRNSRYGPRAIKEVSPDWKGLTKKNRKGVEVPDKVEMCRIVWRNSPAEIAKARRRYLAWYGALMDIRDVLKRSPLERFVVTDRLPDRAPWRKKIIDREI